MMDCNPLATPMVPNLKLHVDFKDFNPLVYRELIKCLIYLVSSILD
jgi:hypothetical protein